MHLWSGNEMLPPYVSSIPVGFSFQNNCKTKKSDLFSTLELKSEAFLN